MIKKKTCLQLFVCQCRAARWQTADYILIVQLQIDMLCGGFWKEPQNIHIWRQQGTNIRKLFVYRRNRHLDLIPRRKEKTHTVRRWYVRFSIRQMLIIFAKVFAHDVWVCEGINIVLLHNQQRQTNSQVFIIAHDEDFANEYIYI